MKVKVWGCRGSLPTPGAGTIRYGGNTTCLEIRLKDNTVVIVDAGSGIRALGTKMFQEPDSTEIYLFLTHAHWDHLMGFPFFGPAYSSKYRIHVRGGPRAKGSLQGHLYLKHQMSPPYFPVPFDAMNAEFDFTSGDPKRVSIGPAEVIPIRLNHPNGGYGFKITDQTTCYKAFRNSVMQKINLKCNGFEFCSEVTARVRNMGYTIIEVPIEYNPRSFSEGKKIRWKDGLRAAYILGKYKIEFFFEKSVRHGGVNRGASRIFRFLSQREIFTK